MFMSIRDHAIAWCKEHNIPFDQKKYAKYAYLHMIEEDRKLYILCMACIGIGVRSK